MKAGQLVFLFVVLLWLYREWSWSSWGNQRRDEITNLHEQVFALKLQHKAEVDSFAILLEQLSSEDKTMLLQCNTTDILKNLSTSVGQAVGNKSISSFQASDSIGTYSVFSWKMFFLIAGFCAFIMYELDGIYGITEAVNTADETYNKELDSHIRSFLIRHHPLLSCLFFVIWYLFSWLGWLGLVNNVSLVNNAMMSLFGMIVSTIIIFAGTNIRQIWKYLPKTMENMKNRCSDLEWWGWFLSRLFGFHDMKSATTSLCWMICLIWVYWPYRYFYGYVDVCCGNKEQVYSFLMNNISHLAIMVCICYYFYGLLMILPSLNEMHANPEDQPTLFGRLVMKVLLRYLRPMLLYGVDERMIGILVFISVINSLLCFLRLLYFLVMGNLTIYAWLVAWMFFHAHLMFSLIGVQVLNILMQQLKVEVLCKNSFISRFVASQSHIDADEDGNGDREKYAKQLFDTYLSKSAVFALFMDVPTPETGDQRNDEDLSTNKVYKAFQVFIQLDASNDREGNEDTTGDS